MRIPKERNVKALRFTIAILASLASLAPAQNTAVPAGGKWTMSETEEKMTGQKRVKFDLPADNYLPDSDRRPEIMLFCVGGKLKLADFHPNLRLSGPNRASFWGRPQMHVTVRIDNHHTSHNWNWVNGDFLAMDEDTARGLIQANIFKVEFNSKEGSQIAEFTPAGIDVAKVHQACGIKPEKP
jgi:hypothetical protein